MIGSHVSNSNTVRFRFQHGHAPSVAVAGNFSGWQPVEMQPLGAGRFGLDVENVPAGEVEYKFLTPTGWAYDPANYRISPDGLNSSLSVGGRCGELHYQRLHSPALATDVDYLTYVPPQYALETQRAFPVLLLLGNLLEESTAWVDYVRVNDILDGLIQADAISPMIVVMPGKESFSARVEPWMAHLEFLTRDLLDHVEAEYRTLGLHAADGIGLGGIWALRSGLTAPERFCSIGCISTLVPSYLHGIAERRAEQVREAGTRFRLACGTSDPELMQSMGDFREQLDAEGIRSEFLVNDGPNDWPLWSEQIQYSLGFHDYSFRNRW